LELKDLKDKESYSLGYQFGQSLKYQGLDINLEVYTSGIKDGLGGLNPQLGQKKIHQILSELQRTIAARQKALKEKTEKNLSESKIFIKQNTKN